MALRRYEQNLQNKLGNARFMASDRVNRQQMATQNALSDINLQTSKLGLQRGQDQQAFMQAARTGGIENALKAYPVIGASMIKQQATGASTDISRYADLAERQWKIDHPGVPMPPKNKMQAIMDIKRAQAGEAKSIRDVKNISDVTYGAPKKESEETGKLTAVNNMDTYKSAYAASDNIEKIDGLIEHLGSSEAITGMGAEFLKDMERVKTLFGSKVASIKVSDTEVLDAMMGSEVFPLIKALGIGARGMDTPAEREFLRAVMTGAIPLNKQTLLRMAQDRRKVAGRAITRYNKKIDDGSLNNFFRHSGIPKEKINKTPQTKTLPVGVTEDDISVTMKANNLTREQVLTRLRSQ